MAIKKVKLNYMTAVEKIPPVRKIAVSSSHIEELDRDIKQKVMQNEAERVASMDVAGQYMVR